MTNQEVRSLLAALDAALQEVRRVRTGWWEKDPARQQLVPMAEVVELLAAEVKDLRKHLES